MPAVVLPLGGPMTWECMGHSSCSQPSPPHCRRFPSPCRLKDVEHSEGRLYLVFEWLDKDLKKYMDSCSGGLGMPLIKVRAQGGRSAPCAFREREVPVGDARSFWGGCASPSQLWCAPMLDTLC